MVTMWRDYSKFYQMIDTNKYEFTENGIYSIKTNKKIEGYKIGRIKKYHQHKFVCIDGIQRSLYIHVALWIHFYGNIPTNLEINHKDGNQSNNILSNLELITHIDNMNYQDTQRKKAEGIRNSIKIKQKRGGK